MPDDPTLKISFDPPRDELWASMTDPISGITAVVVAHSGESREELHKRTARMLVRLRESDTLAAAKEEMLRAARRVAALDREETLEPR